MNSSSVFKTVRLIICSLLIAIPSTLLIIGTASSQSDVVSDNEMIKAGETTFYQNCVYCHGARGVGGRGKKLQCRDLDPDYLFDVISNGLTEGSFFMPAWKDSMDERMRRQLVSYVKSLGTLASCG